MKMKRILLAALMLVATNASTVSAGEHKSGGAGMYTDPSVAGQISTFTLNRGLVSCGVADTSPDGPMGVFYMLMLSTDIDNYRVDHQQGTITATGTMRSITNMAGNTVEDVLHDFIAVG